MAGKPRKWSDEDLRTAVAAATCWEQVTKILGLAGGAAATAQSSVPQPGWSWTPVTSEGKAGTGSEKRAEP
jgi:hypothetical protein